MFQQLKIPSMLAVLGLVLILAACNSQTTPVYEVVTANSITPGSAIPSPKGESILTISGDIGIKNAGDSLQFDMETLESLGLVKYTIEDPWLNTEVTYAGVRMSELLKFAGVSDSASNMHVVALDDYEVDYKIADMRKWPVLLVTQADGEHMKIDDAGPTRVIFPIHQQSSDEITASYQKDQWIWNVKSIEIQ